MRKRDHSKPWPPPPKKILVVGYRMLQYPDADHVPVKDAWKQNGLRIPMYDKVVLNLWPKGHPGAYLQAKAVCKLYRLCCPIGHIEAIIDGKVVKGIHPYEDGAPTVI